jgi:hypothetical protein
VKSSAALAAWCAIGLAAAAARADWEVSAKLTCFASDTQTLSKAKSGDDALVALCLGVDPAAPAVADYALVLGTDPRELRVLRRCDSQLVCVLSTELGCSLAGPMNDKGFKRKGVCVHHLQDVGVHDLDGSFLCNEGDRYTVEPSRYTYKAACSGEFALDGAPCTIQLKTGREFEGSGACPQ